MTESQTPTPSDPNPFGAPPVPPAAPTVPPAPAAAEVSAPAPASAPAAPAAPAGLDDGTYSELRTPRSASALALDGTWHQISPRYVVSQLLQNGLLVVAIAAAMIVLALVFDQTWAWIPGGILIVVTLITMIILPRQAKAVGYMLRADDIVFRRGIIWQRMVAVPYGRLQLVDITHGPLDRAFGVSQLKMVTAAATTGVQIPGLTQAAAETLRDTLIEVAETRRTGL
ncbi:PH domain-containing protein [Microbacterium esteraromaticum]|uniref:PH domain-containing protein n=1 Tax=Microbacterium esteraromaticum TaxID=57043 RepID=UPI0019D36C39|nr:PH domain-containing protein [Microbacterium esteraromaticum]MBN7793619.1 PH domain-containing protein [Microbacterium esteraromaticum]